MRKGLKVLALVGGVAAAALGLLGGLFVAVSPRLLEEGVGGDGPAARLSMAVSLVTVGCGLGLPLAWTALRALRGVASPAARWRGWWLWAVLALLVGFGGQALLAWVPLPEVFFPLLYVPGILAPVLAVLMLVGRRLARHGLVVTRREVLAQLASGGLLGTSLALVLEMMLFVCLVLAAIVGLVLTPGGLERLQALAAQLQAAGGTIDPGQLLPLLRSGWLVGLVLFGIAVAAPAAEEAVKALGVLLLGYRRPEPARAFLWGVSGGAGFALVEGLLNSVLAVGGGPTWGFVVLSRSGALIVHCLAGGLAGLGWQALLSGVRRWRALGYYAAAVTLHGLWNGLAGAAGLLQLMSSDGAGTTITPGVATWGVGALAFLLAGLLATQIVLLLAIAGRLGGAAAQ